MAAPGAEGHPRTERKSLHHQCPQRLIEIPKKQGKSELAAAVALLLLCGDGEERAEVYGCAADRNQAKIVFDVAVDMVRFCPALAKRVKILESQKKLVYKPTNSSYQVLSADVANKHGFNTHGVIFDELHPYDVTVKIDALAASAASVIAMAGTKVLMSPVAMIMVHNPATIAIGDSDEMQKAIDMLAEVKESIMNAYEIKTGITSSIPMRKSRN